MPFEQDDKVYCRKFGNRREVLDGVAFCTSGKLTADRLEERGGKIISKKRSEQGKVRYAEKNPFSGKVKVEPEPKVEVAKPKPKPRKRRKAKAKAKAKKATTKQAPEKAKASVADVSSEPASKQPRILVRRRRRKRLRALLQPQPAS